MTKTTGILISTVATGIVAATIPTALLTSDSNKSKTESLIPRLSSAIEIREKYRKVKCLNDYFGTIKFDKNKTKKPTFDNVNTFSSNSNSCLMVEYHKKTYTGEKWKGEFRLIWSVKDTANGQGFITVTNARTQNDEWLRGNSTAYTLKKDNSGNSWSTSNIQEIKEDKKDDSSLKRLIPQKSASLPGTLDTTKYWGFNPILSKVCKRSECNKEKEATSIHNFYSWDFVGGDGNEELHSWTSNIDNWLDKIFAWKTLKNKIQGVKGKWKENKVS